MVAQGTWGMAARLQAPSSRDRQQTCRSSAGGGATEGHHRAQVTINFKYPCFIFNPLGIVPGIKLAGRCKRWFEGPPKSSTSPDAMGTTSSGSSLRSFHMNSACNPTWMSIHTGFKCRCHSSPIAKEQGAPTSKTLQADSIESDRSRLVSIVLIRAQPVDTTRQANESTHFNNTRGHGKPVYCHPQTH